MNTPTIKWAEQEFAGSKLPDERFRSNLYKMAASLADKPDQSFSSACGETVRKAAWRLFSTTELDLSGGHEIALLKRCAGHDIILVPEDTTDLNYWNHKQTEGLGLLGGSKIVLGLAVHSAIALSEAGEPLGIVCEHIWAPVANGEKQGKHHTYPITEKESNKWLLALDWVKECFNEFSGTVVLIGDREADIYEHFAAKRAPNVELLVRARDLRRKVNYASEPCKVGDLAQLMPLKGQLSVKVNRQKDRKERIAELEVRFGEVVCPATTRKRGEALKIFVVHAKEIKPEIGTEPIEWFLFTTLRVDNIQTAIRMLEYYAKRWKIERFHYVLKQGLKIERLQFDNFVRLKNAIQLYLIVGWYLLRLSSLAKVFSDEPATEYFDLIDIQILEQTTGKKIKTVEQYVLSLSSLQGFAPSQKQPLPGEKILWQSLKMLMAMRRGADAMKNYETG
jgi:hypothetical protein